MKTFISDISKKEFPVQELASGHIIIHPLLDLVQTEFPGFTEQSSMSISELNHFRQQYIENYLISETGQLTDLEKNVIDKIKDQSTISDKVDEEQAGLTVGQRLADKIALFGGSWKFIIFFLSFILVWILVNLVWLTKKGFDPFPFILLNLILSCIAAMQAPVIMMSQNRQEEKDRQRSRNDYMINLKSELEIRMLHEKIDHLVIHQQKELMEVQKMQIDMLNEIMAKTNGKNNVRCY
ncbi:MAG: DUF1003 domain-containing protein [Porphyromonadaceae bacterium]|nr:MAG: DUF1003 domain-containing protein [Porphyromonadaceae bacterium]